jgi:hypothetical protein
MTIELVQTQSADNAESSSLAISGLTTTAGNALILGITLTSGAPSPIWLTSVTDSAGNTWTYSTVSNSQNPPSGWRSLAYLTSSGLAAMACCLNTNQSNGQVQGLSSGSVSITWNVETSFYNAMCLQEWSGLPAEAEIIAAGAQPGPAGPIPVYT